MDGHRVSARARVHGGPIETLPPRLLASWERSETYGVPLEEVQPLFSGTGEPESLFFRCGNEVLAGLAETLANEPVSMMLTDGSGLVLNRFSGDHSLLRALDAVHLAPGFCYSERDAGTNGLGLALADRVPTVVRAAQHYSLSLCTYTCAAVPVLDPLTGRLEGAVNLTTWSQSSSDLLLALAQSAAGTTSALMLARSQGERAPRPAPRGEVFRVAAPTLEPGLGSLEGLSPSWTDAQGLARGAIAGGSLVTALGEPGSGRSTLLAQAHRQANPRARILAARSPAPQDVEAWLSLWSPELAKPETAVVVRDVDLLPLWAAERLRDLVLAARTPARDGGISFSMTAERCEDIPVPLTQLVESIVRVPALRERPDDVVPLARHAAHRARGREVRLTGAAERALQMHAWPGNVEELVASMRYAATRADEIDVRHLPPTVLVGTNRRLSRLETFERDEIVRVLSQRGTSMTAAAQELAMSRATLYRKVAHYQIHIPR